MAQAETGVQPMAVLVAQLLANADKISDSVKGVLKVGGGR